MQRETKDRLIREGKWEQFNQIREHLKKQGEAPAMCETKALLIVDTKIDGAYDPDNGRIYMIFSEESETVDLHYRANKI